MRRAMSPTSMPTEKIGMALLPSNDIRAQLFASHYLPNENCSIGSTIRSNRSMNRMMIAPHSSKPGFDRLLYHSMWSNLLVYDGMKVLTPCAYYVLSCSMLIVVVMTEFRASFVVSIWLWTILNWTTSSSKLATVNLSNCNRDYEWTQKCRNWSDSFELIVLLFIHVFLKSELILV